MNHCIDGGGRDFSDQFPRMCHLFLDSVEKRPLHMEQMLLHMVSIGTLVRENECLYLRRPEQFHEQLTGTTLDPRGKLPLDEIYARRIDFIKTRFRKHGEVFLRALAFFREVDERHLLALGFPGRILSDFMSMGIARLGRDGKVTLFHQTLYRYITRRFPDFTNAVYDKILTLCSEQGLYEQYLPQCFLLAVRSGAPPLDLVRLATERLADGDFYNDYFERFAVEYVDQLDRCKENLPPERWVRAISAAAETVRTRVGLQKAVVLYDQAARGPLSNPQSCHNAGLEYLIYELRYAGSCLGIRQDERALCILRAINDRLPSLRFSSQQERLRSQAQVLNRLCVAQRSMSLCMDAIATGNECLEMARKCNAPEIEMQAHIDLGYIYYGNAKDRDSLLGEWRNAQRIFVPTVLPDDIVITNEGVPGYHRAHVLTLEQKFDEARDLIDNEINKCSRRFDLFHESKLRLLAIVIELARPDSVAAPECLFHMVGDLVDFCSRYSTFQTYWMAFYAEAKIHFRQGEVDKGLIALHRAYDQLMLRLGVADLEDRYRPFFEDYVMAFRIHDAKPPSGWYQRLRSHRLRNALLDISLSEPTRFKEFLECYMPTATYHDGRFNLPCP